MEPFVHSTEGINQWEIILLYNPPKQINNQPATSLIGSCSHLGSKCSPSVLQWDCYRKGDPFEGPRVGSCLTLRKTHVCVCVSADKARDSIGKGCLGREQQGKGTQENCSATWLAVSGFMVMALVSGLSLANRSDLGSFLVACALLSQDGFQQEGSWEVGRTYGLASPLFF